MYGAVALRRRCYIIPHPTIYLVLEFEANRLKNDRVIEPAPFVGGAAGNGAAAPHTVP